MFQCHDEYDREGIQQSTAKPAVGSQCHDGYDSMTVSPVTDHHCEFVTEQNSSARVLRVIGTLDWATERSFREAVDEVTHGPVVIDLSTARTSSGATGALVAVAIRLRQRGQKTAMVVTDPLEFEVLGSVGLNELVPIVGTLSEALKAIDPPAVSADDLLTVN